MYKLMKYLMLVGVSASSVSANAEDCTNLNNWVDQSVYNTGDTVQSGGNAYRANWWTQGNNPASNSGPEMSGQPWLALGACTTGGGNPDPDPIPDPDPTPDPDPGTGGGNSECSGIANYVAGTSYVAGARVANQNTEYSCTIAGWCSSAAAWAYEPGVGAHWQSAWSEVGACTGGGGDTNVPPVANVNGPYQALEGVSIAFSSAGSSDTGGSIVSYAWAFGDGGTSSVANPTHSYAQAGTYAVTLTVTDNEGASTTASSTATIARDPGDGTGGGNTSGKNVIAYFTQWGVYARNYHIKNLVTSGTAEHLTHIVYAFGNVQNGQCVIGDSYADYDKYYAAGESVDGTSDSWDAGELRGNFNQIRKLKALYPNIKVVWSFGGWTWSGGFGQASQNPAAFAESCYNLVNDPRWSDVFDGIDIDWEYPNTCGLT